MDTKKKNEELKKDFEGKVMSLFKKYLQEKRKVNKSRQEAIFHLMFMK